MATISENKETAEDLCSQAFLNALTHYDSYYSSKASVKTWLCTIARNLITNHMTSAAVRLSAPLEDEQESAAFFPSVPEYLQDARNSW